jgi:tetratricopeptide (TPR) repeat protein
MFSGTSQDALRARPIHLRAPASRVPPHERRLLWLKPVIWLFSGGLLIFNLCWYWRDSRPIADLETISNWISQEKYSQAEPDLREHIRRASHNGEARVLLAKVLGAKGDLLGCAKQLHEVPRWWPTKADALFHEGQAYLMANRAKDAEACWQAVVQEDPLHPVPSGTLREVILQLLSLYATENRWEDAAIIVWHAYEQTSQEDHLALLSMRVRSELERLAPEATIGIVKRYVAADPYDWEALRALARAELSLNLKDEAERHFQACLKGDPNNPRVWRDYLSMLHDTGNEEALGTLLGKVPEVAEREPEIWRLRALLKEKSGDWIGAARDYGTALDRNPFLMASHYRLAMVEERLGRHESAAAHRKKADQLRDARGELRAAFNNVVAAEEARQQQKAIKPDLPTALRKLASVCETLGWARLALAWNKLAESS